MFNENNKRSLAKALTWRVLATLATILVVYGFTGNWVLSVGVGGVEVLVKILLYIGHERVWALISWGYHWHGK